MATARVVQMQPTWTLLTQFRAVTLSIDGEFLPQGYGLRVALQVCDRIAVMLQGQIVEAAATADISPRPRHPHSQALFAAVPGAGWQDRRNP